ncbi:copper chaperone PCu(A)C [Erythrobacter sp. R86502]|uniref:copper chaperone PCu(A)C n=1 Tax=Erythrobacter sp. R86502 TaxID=3093846 RepID=UPI0036D3AF39
MTSFRQAALAILLSAGAAGLAACSDQNDGPVDAATEGLAVRNARVVLAPVAGNPAAVYFDLSYSGDASAVLTDVAVEGAGMTMIHDYAENAGKMQMIMADDVTIVPGTPVIFAPGGLHVMAMQPAATLQAGSSANVTFTLSDGTRTVVTAPVRAAGEER